ncbi:MAG: molybdenum cofactor guanylyltransferase MobA [Methylococcales bacterium]|nr:molybdenum cofactor guanylyltransferase MobA [Methylococcales bacterium]
MTELDRSLAPIPPFVNVTGVILAGGRGSRMGGADKGWIDYQGRPLIEHALSALHPVASKMIISANRNIAAYQALCAQVVTDLDSHFQGPLAGILAALMQIDTDYALIIPCDAPHITPTALRQLFVELQANPALNLTIASDGIRLQPVFMALRTSVTTDLETFLASGQRKLMSWAHSQHHAVIPFDNPKLFVNLNSADDLTRRH